MIVTDAPIKDAAYWTHVHLQNWAAWMERDDPPDGVPREASGGAENYSTLDAHSELAYAKLDAWAAENTNAVIDGLPDAEQAAIYHCYIQAVYRFLRGNYDAILARARGNVQAGLRRRGVWLGQ